jgi:hypothetical protein
VKSLPFIDNSEMSFHIFDVINDTGTIERGGALVMKNKFHIVSQELELASP